MSPTLASSIFRKESENQNEAVLITGPKISEHDSLTVIDSESCQNVDVSQQQQQQHQQQTSNPFRRLLESSIGAAGRKKSTDEQEMEEIEEIDSPMHKRESVDNYDICREYSYDSDDELSNHYFNTSPAVKYNRANKEALNSKVARTESFLLGKTYHPINDYDSRRDDESSLFWFTYRCDFPCIEPYGITSDAGWGCMLRALQMMMGQALRLHYKSREWRPQHSLNSRRQDPFIRSILTWFADFPSSNECIYSLHNMVAAGLTKYDKLPGEWYGPGTACYVIRDLVEMHQRRDPRMFRVHVAAGGTVYRDAIEDTMTRDNKLRQEKEIEEKAKEIPPPAHPLDVAWEEELLGEEQEESMEWDTALLLLVPLRLGLKNFNQEYDGALSFIFSLPQSVGVLGGRPRGARWFYGALSDGSKIFGLDPHTVQAAPKRRNAKVNGSPSTVIDLSDEYMRSVHTTYPEVFALAKLDPSIALGFYCRNRSELESVFSSLRDWKIDHPKVPELFTVADKAPDYANTSAMEDGMFDSIVDEDTECEKDTNEEDEFVIL